MERDAESREKDQEGVPDFLRTKEPDFNGEPICDVSKVIEMAHVGCGHVLPRLFGKIKTHTDEGYKLKLDMLKIVGMGKDCAIHETVREC
jgi:hypothetical protein